MTVVDASAVVDLLLPPADVERRAFLLAEAPEPGEPWLAPDILPFEVFSVIRRQVLRDALPAKLATHALRRLRKLPITFIPTGSLLGPAWNLRTRFSAAGALYASLALRAQEPLLTTDKRLARAASAHSIAVLQP